jgi:DNA mismatch endonuclease, patch repair protein
MTDVFSKAKRSEVMSRIRSRGNRDTELALVHLLRAHKISGWRRHVRVAVESRWLRVESRKRGNTSSGLRPPSPQSGEGAGLARRVTPQPSTFNPQLAVRHDFVFRKSRTAIFVDGCFWHGCPRHATKPANNRAFWRRKLAGNKKRDALVTRTLRRAGWKVVRIWEHELARPRGKHRTSNIELPTSNGRQKGEPSGLVKRIQRALDVINAVR